MTTGLDGPPCQRCDCPIVDPGEIDRRSLRVERIDAGTQWYRAVRTEYARSPFAPPGSGSGRFSPLAGRGHAYVAAQRSAALLESALHETAGSNPQIYAALLRQFTMCHVELTRLVRLIDLRDGALAELGVERRRLTGSDALHYPCSQRVAQHLAGTKSTVGFVWSSRQGHLHAERNTDGLAAEVLRHDSLDVAVLYDPDAAGAIRTIGTEPLMVDDRPTRFVLELANLLRIAVL